MAWSICARTSCIRPPRSRTHRREAAFMFPGRSSGLTGLTLQFAPDIVRLERRKPPPLPRAVLHVALALFAALVSWAYFGKLDIVAVSQGKLVPQSFLKILQPA